MQHPSIPTNFAEMASKHESKRATGASKRVITYGKTPRKANPLDTSTFESGTSRMLPSQTTSRSTSTPSAQSAPTPRRLQGKSSQDRPREAHAMNKADREPELRVDPTRKRKLAAFASESSSTAEQPRPDGKLGLLEQPEQPEQSHKRSAPSDATYSGPSILAKNRAPGAKAPPKTSDLHWAERKARGTSVAPSRNPAKTIDGSLTGSTQSKPRRPRLIDALAAQRADSPESSSEESSASQSGQHSRHQDSTEMRDSLSQRLMAERDARPRMVQRSLDSSNGRKIKFTYSHSRSIRDDGPRLEDPLLDDPGADAHDALLSQSLLPDSLGLSAPADFDFDEDDDEANPKVAIKSVHELRRAGANHRFSDEMDDLFSRIATPNQGSLAMRRNALLELAQKLQRKSFAGQFRDHALRDNIAKDIGKEKDLIGGFALASALVVFFSLGPAPNLLRQLANDRVGKLIAHLLKESDDIEDPELLRRCEFPRSGRGSLSNVKNLLKQLRIWHGYEPVAISPRTAGMQLLEMISQWVDARDLEILMRDLDQELNAVADLYVLDDSEDVDFALLIRVLEAQSSISPSLDDGNLQMASRGFAVAKYLHRALERQSNDRRNLDMIILRLSINTTNTAKGASAFDDGPLLSSLSNRIYTCFGLVQQALSRGQWQGTTYEQLVLLLGVAINILEHCHRARGSVDVSSLNKLITLYLDNRGYVSEADSEDASKLSVAFGYLAVLLGYLYLDPTGRAKMNSAASGQGRRLVESIQEFIAMYKSVDSKAHELEGLVSELRRL